MQSIETFAVTVKEIAQLLQGFGSELSDTELPDEATAIEFLEHSHTHRYRQMKVAATAPWSPLVSLLALSDRLHTLWFLCLSDQDDICGVLKEGRLLLSNLETVKAAKKNVEEEREIQSDMETVQRCSTTDVH